jgi:hypothetical protein
MKYTKGTVGLLITLLIIGISMDALGFLGFGNSVSWQEEVLLHDGQKIIVKRHQTLGGKPTLDSRERTTLEEEWIFPVPGTERKISWKTGFKSPPEGPCLMLVLVGFPGGIPYIATVAAGCTAYNHWGRPNPPYVFFKYDGANWQRIPLEEFPTELKEVNVAVGRPDSSHRTGLLSIATIKGENRNLEIHMRQIVREPVKVAQTVECEELIFYKGAWIGPGDSIGKRMMDRKSK